LSLAFIGDACALGALFNVSSAESLLQSASRVVGSCGEPSSTELPDRWVEAFASLELAALRVASGDLEGAAAAIRLAAAVRSSQFSFHSWHDAKLRDVRNRMRAAAPPAVGGGNEGGAAASAAVAATLDEEELLETEEVAALRRQLEAAEITHEAAAAL
jgi:hypothetical protein